MAAKTHDLKSWPQFFRPIIAGERTHELRRNDRDFAVGDDLLLREYDPTTDAYTESVARAEVTSVTSQEVPCAVSDQGLHADFCILSIRVVSTWTPDAPYVYEKRDN